MASFTGQNPNLQAGMALLQAGSGRVASEWFMASVARYPSCAPSHYWAGVLSCQEGRMLEGRQLLARAVSIIPEPDYLQALIDVCARLDLWAEAVSAFEQLFARRAPSVEWRYRYALAHLNSGNVAAAVTALEQCLEQDVACEPALVLLGDLYMKTNRHGDSRQMLERSYQHGVRTESLFRLLSRCCTEMGDTARALEVLSEAAQCFPDTLQFHYFASLIDLSSVPDPVWARLEKGLSPAQASAEQEMYRHFLLARRACAHRQFDLELQELSRAHAMVERHTSFAIPKEVYLKQLPNSVMKGRELRSIAQVSDVALTLFVGMPRSGSTLLENVLCAGAPELVKGEEVSACAGAFFRAFDAGSNSVNMDMFLSGALTTYRQCNLLRGGCGLTDKSLDNAFYLDAILTAFPKARVIWCQRDVVASAMSIFQRNLSLAWAHRLEDIAAYAEVLERVMSVWMLRFSGRILIVRHEDFIRDPEAESKRMFDFLGRTWSKACLSVAGRQNAVSRTSSSVQIRSGIHASPKNAIADYGALISPFLVRSSAQ